MTSFCRSSPATARLTTYLSTPDISAMRAADCPGSTPRLQTTLHSISPMPSTLLRRREAPLDSLLAKAVVRNRIERSRSVTGPGGLFAMRVLLQFVACQTGEHSFEVARATAGSSTRPAHAISNIASRPPNSHAHGRTYGHRSAHRRARSPHHQDGGRAGRP